MEGPGYKESRVMPTETRLYDRHGKVEDIDDIYLGIDRSEEMLHMANKARIKAEEVGDRLAVISIVIAGTYESEGKEPKRIELVYLCSSNFEIIRLKDYIMEDPEDKDILDQKIRITNNIFLYIRK